MHSCGLSLQTCTVSIYCIMFYVCTVTNIFCNLNIISQFYILYMFLYASMFLQCIFGEELPFSTLKINIKHIRGTFAIGVRPIDAYE